MYIIIRSWYPPSKADEVAKKYLKVMEKYPPDESLSKPVVPVAVSPTKDGIETLTVSEAVNEKLADALNRNMKRLVEMHEIEGYTYEMNVWLTVEEALAAIGMG